MSASILVLHSSSATAGSFARTLDEIGLQPRIAEHPDEACQAIRITRPDVVLVAGELILADTSLCHKLRICSPEKRLPIIMLVPLGVGDVSHFLCGADVDDYITQPYSLTELEARLMLRLSIAEKKSIRPLPEIDFSFLSSLSSLVVSERSQPDLLTEVVMSVAAAVDVNRCSILALGEQGDSAEVLATSDDPNMSGIHIALERYPEIQEVIRSGRPLLINNVLEHPLMLSVRQYLQATAINSILVLPMINRQMLIGIMVMRSARPISGFSEDEICFCQLVANIATSALCLAELSTLECSIRDRERVATTNSAAEAPEAYYGLLCRATQELRILISVVDGYCMLFGEAAGEKLTVDQNEIIAGVLEANRRIVDMTNDLLDFSQFVSGHFKINLQRYDIGPIVGSVCAELAPLFRCRKVVFHADCLNRELLLVCDEQAIRRVFYNLLTNALRFSSVGGDVSLSLVEGDGELRFSIEYNGAGFKPEQIMTLFDGDSMASVTDSKVGSVLGLSLCKKIIEAHHGRMWGESFLGQGARFTFCLPC